MSDSTPRGLGPAAITPHHCDTAAQLLDLLSPRHDWWGAYPHIWIFRGQSDTWPLKAKAHRDKVEDFRQIGLREALADGEQRWQLDEERITLLLANFSDGLDRAGLPVPAPAPRLSGPRREIQRSNEPPPSSLPLVALAQHFGLPTPWLDWSRSARFAAYFACADLVWGGLRPGKLVVWGLKSNFVLKVADTAEHNGTSLALVTVPSAENERLHAQAGLFTWLRGERPHTTAVEELVASLVAADPEWLMRSPPLNPPFMRCLTLDRLQAPLLLRLLADDGVTAATVFPGHEGVVRAMKEKAWCDYHLGAGRS